MLALYPVVLTVSPTHATLRPKQDQQVVLPLAFMLRSIVGMPALVAVVSSWPVAVRADDMFFGEMPMVLTASRLAQSPLDAPAAVTTIDREMIEASGFTEIHDLLRLVPGFLVADWPDGSPTVANHGLGDAYDRRIKVMIDGRTVNNPLWGNTEWQDLPVRVDDVDRIEVVRGPNGAAFGANAFQGVVNIITRAPTTEEGVTLITRLGDYGFRDNGFRINGRSGEAVDWRLSGSQRAAVTFKSYRDDEGEPKSEEAVHRTVMNFQASAQLGARDEVRLHMGASDGADRRGYPPETADFSPIRTDRNRHHYLQLSWTRSFDPESDLNVQYYHQSYRVRSDWSSRDGYPVDIDIDTRRDDIEVQYTRRLSPEWQLLVGGGARRDAARSQTYFFRSDTLQSSYWQTFGSLTWQPIPALRINLGGTYEHHDYSGRLLSPRLAINYALSADSALRFSTGTAYRAPSLMESDALQTVRAADGRIVRVFYHAGLQIDPERVRYTELGYVAQFRDLGLSVDTRVFREQYSDYIDDQLCRHTRAPRCAFAPPPGYNRSEVYFLNSGAFTMRGFEFSLDWRKPGFGRAVLSQAFIDIKEDGDVLDEHIRTSAPVSTTSLLLIKELPYRWRVSVGYYHNHPMHWLNDGGELSSRDRYDFKIAKAFGPQRNESEIALTVQSAGGAYPEFDENQFRAQPQVFASLRLSW